MKVKPKYKLVLVKWQDASSLDDQGWKNFDDYHYDPEKILSAGFLVKENKKRIVLYANIQDEKNPDKAFGQLTIPKSAIIWQRELDFSNEQD